MPKVFISYRRDDVGPTANALKIALSERYCLPNVFRDENDIAKGSYFIQQLGVNLSQSSLVLVLVGPDWQSVRRPNNDTPTYLLDDDWIKTEVETALDLGIQVAPVLVDIKSINRKENEPNWIKRLFQIQALNLRLLSQILVEMLKQSRISRCKKRRANQRLRQELTRLFDLTSFPAYHLQF